MLAADKILSRLLVPIDMDNIDTGPGLSPHMPCLFTAGLLSWALSLGKGKYRNIHFSRKVLTRFSIQKYA
jgi:hypothetical protein